MKVAVQAKRSFNRNLDGQMVVGHPKHRDVRGRFFLLSATSAAALVSNGDGEEISRETYDKEMRKAEGSQVDAQAGGVASARESQTGRPAGEVRLETTRAADGSRSTNAGAANAVTAKVTMSNEMLDGMAAERGIDISGAKSRGEKAKLINGTAGKPVETDVEPRGVTGNLSDGSTNHDPISSPHQGVGAAGSVQQDAVVPAPAGAGTEGLQSADDAAPTGGGGGAPEGA